VIFTDALQKSPPPEATENTLRAQPRIADFFTFFHNYSAFTIAVVHSKSNFIMSSWNDLFNIKHCACIEKDASSMTSYLEAHIFTIAKAVSG